MFSLSHKSSNLYAQGIQQLIFNPYTLLVVTALSAWLLDGFNIGPVNDGWVMLGLMGKHAYLLGDAMTLRIFGKLPTTVGNWLTDGFQGWQVMLLLLTCLRGILFFVIMRRLLPSEPLFAAACGLIALFHPADTSWFWVESVGVHLSFVLTLASCWTSLVYLQGGSRTWLYATFLFQLANCETYTAFLPLMFVFPFGAWILLKLQGSTPLKKRLFASVAVLPIWIILEVFVIAIGRTHENKVADLQVRNIFLGYIHESLVFMRATIDTFVNFKPIYLLFALVPAVIGYFYVYSRQASLVKPKKNSTSAKFHGSLLIGLLLLAAISYFPYSLSNVRFGNERQLIAAGVFLYTALFYILIVLLPRYLTEWPRIKQHLPRALLIFQTVMTVVVGIEYRSHFVTAYRYEERLIAEVAKLVPQPLPGTTILVRMENPHQFLKIMGFYNRWSAFESALKVMYGDKLLHAGFLPNKSEAVQFAKQGVVIPFVPNRHVKLESPYSNLIVIYYPIRGSAHIVGSDELQQIISENIKISDYQPENLIGTQPDESAITCRMLEKRFRPEYCNTSQK